MGTPGFAVLSLQSLWNKYPISLVVTNPDRPAGRGMKLIQSPVKKFAVEKNIPVCDDLDQFIQNLSNADSDDLNPLIVIVAYGHILPKELVNNFMCINLHASLLPKYRGASPIQSTLLNGDKQTGVSTMLINERMDAGDVLCSDTVEIDINMNASELHDKLATTGAELLLKTVSEIDTLKGIPQEESSSTYCHKIKKEDGLLDLTWEYMKIHNTIRAIGGYFFDNGKRVVVSKSIVRDSDSEMIIKQSNDSTVKQIIELSKNLEMTLKPEGKKEMSVGAYLRGRH